MWNHFFLFSFQAGDAAAMGRKITVEGVKNLSDDMIGRYFSKFGLLIEWTRDEAETSGLVANINIKFSLYLSVSLEHWSMLKHTWWSTA